MALTPNSHWTQHYLHNNTVLLLKMLILNWFVMHRKIFLRKRLRMQLQSCFKFTKLIIRYLLKLLLINTCENLF